MPNLNQSLIQHVAVTALLNVALAVSVAAQGPAPAGELTTVEQSDSSPSQGPGFMTHYDFHLSAAALSINDPRFSWDTHFGGAIDVVDYGVGRASILADYEAVLGDEFRPFDPNQSLYTLETSASVRLGQTEVVGVFLHVSRHLSDRPKRFPVAWNTAGARVLRRISISGTSVDLLAEAGGITQRSFVDYRWNGQFDVLIRRSVTPTLGLLAHANGQLVGVDPSIVQRGNQTGGLAEIGVRLNGRAGAIELFVGVERRIDADPLDRQPQQWVMAGFRLLNR